MRIATTLGRTTPREHIHDRVRETRLPCNAAVEFCSGWNCPARGAIDGLPLARAEPPGGRRREHGPGGPSSACRARTAPGSRPLAPHGYRRPPSTTQGVPHPLLPVYDAVLLPPRGALVFASPPGVK